MRGGGVTESKTAEVTSDINVSLQEENVGGSRGRVSCLSISYSSALSASWTKTKTQGAGWGAGWGWNQLDQTGSCYREGGEVRQEEEEEEDVGRVKRRRGRWDKVEQRIWRELRVEDGRREAGAEEKWGLSVLDMSVDWWSERQTAKGPIPPVM